MSITVGSKAPQVPATPGIDGQRDQRPVEASLPRSPSEPGSQPPRDHLSMGLVPGTTVPEASGPKQALAKPELRATPVDPFHHGVVYTALTREALTRIFSDPKSAEKLAYVVHAAFA